MRYVYEPFSTVGRFTATEQTYHSATSVWFQNERILGGGCHDCGSTRRGANGPCPDKLDTKSNVKGKEYVFPLSQFFMNTEICDVMCFGEVDWSVWSGGYWGGGFGGPVPVQHSTQECL